MSISLHLPARTAIEPSGLMKNRLDGVFVAALTVVFSGIVIFLVDGNAADIDPEGSSLGRLSWYPIYLVTLVAIGIRGAALLPAMPRLVLLYLLVLFSILSVAWSVDAAVTFRRSIALSFTVLAGTYLALRGPFWETLRFVAYGLLVVALIHSVLILLAPSIAIDQGAHAGAWKGFSHEKNQLGGDMARAHFVFAALLWHSPRGRWLATIGLVLTGALVIGSTSTTALLSLVPSYGLVAAFAVMRLGLGFRLLTIWAMVVVLSVSAVVSVMFPEQVTGLVGRDITLTGRTGIWQESLAAITERPWTGYGYNAFWQDPLGVSYDIRNAVDWDVPSAHNAWLEMALSLGLPGLVLLGLLAGTALWRAGAAWAGLKEPFILAFLVQLMIFSMSESLFWQVNTFVTVWFVFLVSAAFLGKPDRR